VIDYAKTAHYFQLAANQGLARAQLHYGECLLGRLEGERDIESALHYFRNSAGHEEAISQLLFAFRLESGIGLLPSVILAVKYYESTSRSLPSDCTFDDWRLRMGIDVPVNFTETAE
jgi:TPR repeat protein